MPPKAVHARDAILDAARELVLHRGVQNASVSAISARSGAPVGSLYHHFGSRDDLVTELWVRAVRRSQAMFLAATHHADAERAATDAALSIYDFVRAHRDDARLLVSFRQEDLLQNARSPRLVHALADLNRPLHEALTDLARRYFGRATRDAIEQMTFAVIDLPFGAVRRHLVAGSELPAPLRDQLRAAVAAALRARRVK
jgi:AcrR family transcriptional regulator